MVCKRQNINSYEKLIRFESCYNSTKRYGCDQILRATLDIPENIPLPITIPHGIDFYHLEKDLDLHCHEPLYMAFRDDIANRVSRYKRVVKFPHPWLLIKESEKENNGEGTLFIAPPPSDSHFDRLHKQIQCGEYPKPWGVLIKDRGAHQEDFDWWVAKGFSVHTAGSISTCDFLFRLRDIFSQYECVASPNMSSAVIFAVSMGKKAFAISDVVIECVDAADWEKIAILDDRGGKIRTVWSALLANDFLIAQKQAEELLGMKYMDSSENLRNRLLNAIQSTVDRPLHLFPVGNGLVYKVAVWLASIGVPVQKLFPNPSSKLFSRITAFFGLNRLVVISGSDFSHYGITGTSGAQKFCKFYGFQLGRDALPGRAFRQSSSQHGNHR